MKHVLALLAVLFYCLPPAQAQLLDKLKKKAEDKIVEKAGAAMDGKKQDKSAENQTTTPNQSDQGSGAGEVQVKRKFDFVPGNKVLYADDFSGTEEGAPPAGWTFTGTAEVASLSKISGKWMMLNHNVWASKELGAPFPENCTFEFDMFMSNANYGWENGGPSPSFGIYIGNDKNNEIHLDLAYYGSRVYYWVSGLNHTENRLDFDLGNYKTRPLTVRVAINSQRLRIWLDELKIIDLQEVVGRKILQSGILKFYCDRADRESYPFISNIRIADAGLRERDLSVAPAPATEPSTAKKEPPASEPAAKPKANAPLSLKDFGTYHALFIAVEDYADPSVNKLDNPVRDAAQLQKTLTTYYNFAPQNVVFLKNPTKKDVFAALSKLRTVVKETDNLLIFYAGHGYWDTDMEKGYWLPADAERDLPTNWIANEDITGYLRAIKSKHSLLVSDACFSGGIFKTRDAFAGQRAVEEVYKMTSRKAITSGTMTVVPDKSVFIQYLVKKLEENKDKYLSEEQLFSQFKTAVINNSPGQVPQFGTILNTGDEGGNFIFIRK